MKGKPPQTFAIPWQAIAALVVVCVAAAFLLMPNQRRLLERQIRDGKPDQALATLRSIPPEDRAADAEFYALTEARLIRQTAVTPEQKREALRSLAQSAARFQFSAPFRKELTEALPLFDSATEAHALIEPHFREAPPEAQVQLANELARRALAAGHPAEAASIYSNVWSRVRTEDTTRELVRLYRQADQATNALGAMDTLAAGNGGLPLSLMRERVDLLRAAGRSADAFQAVTALLEKAPAEERDEISDLFVTLALENNRAADALPELMRRAQQPGQNPKIFRLLADVAKAAGEAEIARDALLTLREREPADLGLRFELGQLSEWLNEPEAAFEHYIASLAPEERRALPRLKELVAALGREEQFLTALLRNPRLTTAADHRLIAQLAAHSARYEEARAAYRKALGHSPSDYALHLDYARLLMNLFEYAEAAQVAEAARKLSPDEIAPRKMLAEIAYREGDFDDALDRYRALAAATKDPEAIARHVSLAESLGETDSLIAGLQQQLQSGVTNAYTYERLAFVLTSLGRTNDNIAVLRAGLRANPENLELTLRLGDALASRGEVDAAAELAAKHPDLRRNADLASLYLAALIRAQKLTEADRFLRSGLPPAFLEDSETLVLRAQVAEGLNRGAEALELYEQLHARSPSSAYYALNRARLLAANARRSEALKLLQPFLVNPDEEALTLAAQIYSDSGDFKRAEEWQRLLLARRPTAQRWGFLGDILLSRGDKTNARRAYQRAADIMLSRMEPAQEE